MNRRCCWPLVAIIGEASSQGESSGQQRVQAVARLARPFVWALVARLELLGPLESELPPAAGPRALISGAGMHATVP